MSDCDFPCAGFVRQAVENYLAEFEPDRSSGIDFALFNPESGVRWIVEVKGGKDVPKPEFHAGLGQLLAYMNVGPRAYYCLALPDTDENASLLGEIPRRVQKALNFWWLLVAEDETVDAIPSFDVTPIE